MCPSQDFKDSSHKMHHQCNGKMKMLSIYIYNANRIIMQEPPLYCKTLTFIDFLGCMLLMNFSPPCNDW